VARQHHLQPELGHSTEQELRTGQWPQQRRGVAVVLPMQLFEPLFDVTGRAVGQLTDQGGPVHPDAAMDAPGVDR
jgi:hypothetical protein